MHYAWTRFSRVLGTTLLISSCGCGEDLPSVDSTTAEAKVSGTITVRGKPMAGGQIAFNPSNYKREGENVRKANIGKDGTYSITTLQGRNTARIFGPMIVKEPQLGYGIHTMDVGPGENVFDIELPPK